VRSDDQTRTRINRALLIGLAALALAGLASGTGRAPAMTTDQLVLAAAGSSGEVTFRTVRRANATPAEERNS
jgi:hypothetical protein